MLWRHSLRCRWVTGVDVTSVSLITKKQLDLYLKWKVYHFISNGCENPQMLVCSCQNEMQKDWCTDSLQTASSEIKCVFLRGPNIYLWKRKYIGKICFRVKMCPRMPRLFEESQKCLHQFQMSRLIMSMLRVGRRQVLGPRSCLVIKADIDDHSLGWEI